MLQKNEMLISLHVTSLFTNTSKYTSINKSDFITCIEFCCESSYFVFDNIYYQQIFGTAKGNPSSLPLANLIMNFLSDTVIKELPFQPKVVSKYVDDLFMAASTSPTYR